VTTEVNNEIITFSAKLTNISRARFGVPFLAKCWGVRSAEIFPSGCTPQRPALAPEALGDPRALEGIFFLAKTLGGFLRRVPLNLYLERQGRGGGRKKQLSSMYVWKGRKTSMEGQRDK